MTNTAGLFERPEGVQACEYVQLGDGKWYHKDVAKELMAEAEAEDVKMTRQEFYEGEIEGQQFTAEITFDPNHKIGSWEPIGDVNSVEKGSGARALGVGKLPLNLIPFRQQLLIYQPIFDARPELGYIQRLLIELAQFEMRKMSAAEILKGFEISDMDEAAYVWAYGANKYAAWNWGKGMQWSVPIGCIGRHIEAIMMGEEDDQESGRPHWGHVVCNVMMLEHYEQFYREGDDRPPEYIW